MGQLSGLFKAVIRDIRTYAYSDFALSCAHVLPEISSFSFGNLLVLLNSFWDIGCRYLRKEVESGHHSTQLQGAREVDNALEVQAFEVPASDEVSP
jgi:hypothetical protein